MHIFTKRFALSLSYILKYILTKHALPIDFNEKFKVQFIFYLHAFSLQYLVKEFNYHIHVQHFLSVD